MAKTAADNPQLQNLAHTTAASQPAQPYRLAQPRPCALGTRLCPIFYPLADAGGWWGILLERPYKPEVDTAHHCPDKANGKDHLIPRHKGEIL